MTLTLQQLRQIKRVHAITDKPLHLFFTDLSSVSSLLIEHLLFRLENHTQPVTLYLLDHSAVALRDVSTGAFMQEDVGQSRSSVIMRRYSGFFRNVSLITAYAPAINQSASMGADVQRMFFLKATEETAVIREAIESFVTQHPVEMKTFFFRQGITQDGTKISMRILINGTYYGGGDSIDTVRVNTNNAQQYVQHALIAQRTFGMVNELISEGGSVSYYELTGDIVFGQVTPSYLLGRLWDGFVSQYVRMYSGIATTEQTVSAIATAFDEFINIPQNEQRVTEAKARLQGRLEDVAHAQLGYLMKTLMKYRETLQNGSEEYRKVMFCVGVLMNLGQANSRAIFGENYLNIILMFILFTKENIYHDDIF